MFTRGIQDAAGAILASTFKDEPMRTFSRIGVVSAVALSALLSPTIFPQEVAAPALKAAADGTSFTLKDAAGKYLGLHFLAGTDAQCAAFVKDYVGSESIVAGVTHVFVYPGEAAQAKVWAADVAPAKVYTDPDHALAGSLKVPVSEGHGHSATIVLDPAGKELFRHVGTSHADHLKFVAFAHRMSGATRRPALDDYNLPRGKTLAVDGYDIVAYHRLSKAVKGKPEFASAYRGVNYNFSTAQHRDLFAADPEKYLPTYGGWCASAMGAKGTKVEIDPTNFKIKDGRLHLFYKGTFSDALKDWNKHEGKWEPAADANWKKLTGEDPIKPR
jgi:YHS domain-containing protein